NLAQRALLVGRATRAALDLAARCLGRAARRDEHDCVQLDAELAHHRLTDGGDRLLRRRRAALGVELVHGDERAIGLGTLELDDCAASWPQTGLGLLGYVFEILWREVAAA